MFSMLPKPAHTHLHTQHYTPAISSPLSSSPLRSSPSPLSPRDPNISTPVRTSFSHYDLMMSPTPNPCKSPKILPPSSSRSSAFSRRVTKPNPLLQKSDEEGRETRRKLFLKKVKEGSEDRRWKARGGEEEMMRTIWVMEERRRIARERELLGVLESGEEYLCLEEVMAEEVEVEEEKELEALLGLMSEEQQPAPPDGDTNALLWGREQEANGASATRETAEPETPYGSDDDEYDHIFMDVIQEENKMSSQLEEPQSANAGADQDMMDMS